MDAPIEAPETGSCASLWVVYSASCVQCRYLKPIVLRLQEEYAGRVGGGLVLQESAQGREFRSRYGVRCSPGAVVTAADGRLLAEPLCGPAGYPALKVFLEGALETGGCLE